MDRGAWQVIVHGVAKSGTRLSDFTNEVAFGLVCETAEPAITLKLNHVKTGVMWRELIYQICML